MITRYSAWMDGQGLQDIDGAIVITDIREVMPETRMVTAERAFSGTCFLRSVRASLSVAIRFMIRERDTVRRREVLRRVRRWAHDGYLSISDRPGERLYVTCERPAALSSALKWTDELEMTFTAFDVPFWEAETPSKTHGSGMYIYLTLSVRGDVESQLDAVIVAQSACADMTIIVGGQAFYFFGLPLDANDTMTISHDVRGRLSIKKGDASLMTYRSGNSSDDIMLSPGANAISFAATAPCTATFTTRGRFE